MVTAAVTGVPGEVAIREEECGTRWALWQVCSEGHGTLMTSYRLCPHHAGKETEAQAHKVSHPKSPHERQRRREARTQEALTTCTPCGNTTGQTSCQALSSSLAWPWGAQGGASSTPPPREHEQRGAEDRLRLWRVPGHLPWGRGRQVSPEGTSESRSA